VLVDELSGRRKEKLMMMMANEHFCFLIRMKKSSFNYVFILRGTWQF